MTPHLEQRLIEIAGKNVLCGNDATVNRLCRCINYLVIQLASRARISEDECQRDISGVLENAAEILGAAQ